MLLKKAFWRLFLLSGTTASLHPRLDSLPYLVARQNNTSANSTENTTIPYPAFLCNIPAPGQNVTKTPITAAPTCQDCTTLSGVLLATSVPSSLVLSNLTATFLSSSLVPSNPTHTDDGGLTNNKRVPKLTPRVPAQPAPLAEPNPADGAMAQEIFMDKLRVSIINDLDDPNNGALNIRPSDKQLNTWQIPLKDSDGRLVDTPIGVTGMWYEFGNTPKNWKMVGMSGCTGVLIVGNTGFWAGHFWESSGENNLNGGSSFNYRYGGKPDDIEERTDKDFQTIAVDILTQATPADQVDNRSTFVSLTDLQERFGDPFSRENGGGNIYIITKAVGPGKNQLKQQKYRSKISILQKAIEKAVRPNTITIRTYLGNPQYFQDPPQTTLPESLNGVTILQYSPFAGFDGKGTSACNRVARARVFEEVNPVPAVDRKWTPIANIQALPKAKRDDACALSTTTFSAPSTSTTVITPPCLVHEDPDNNEGPVCQCNNGAKIPIVTYTNTASTNNLCPWTTIPPQALTTPAPKITSANHAQYQYTYTDISRKVIECESSSIVSDVEPYRGTACVGSTAILHQPPLATMELGSSKVNVGTATTGEVLFTSVSNALTSLCPTPTSDGVWTGCETGTIKVGEATWLNDEEPEDGQVTIHVTDAQYNTTDYLNLFIRMVAGAANASATGNNCKMFDWTRPENWRKDKRDIEGREDIPLPVTTPTQENSTFCNTNDFLDTQWYDGRHEAAQMWFETEFGFELGELGNFDCTDSVGRVGEAVGAFFDAIVPEFAWLVETEVFFGEVACEAAETFEQNARSKRDIEMEKTDQPERLAKAWERERKKDRKLPMPEHKKRELDIIDL